MTKTMRFIVFLFLVFFSCSDNQEHQRAKYTPSEKDSIDFLTSNADAICVIKIYDGIRDGGSAMSTVLTKSASAKISYSLKGPLKVGSNIKILNKPKHDSPGTIHTMLALRNGEYIAFLVNSKNGFNPLSPYSLIEIYPNTNDGRPVWKQTDSEFVDIPDTPKLQILEEIKTTLNKQKAQ